jgi:hypothetical protein
MDKFSVGFRSDARPLRVIEENHFAVLSDLNPPHPQGESGKDHSEEHLRRALDEELNAMSGETELFRSLLETLPTLLRAVREAGGDHTHF